MGECVLKHKLILNWNKWFGFIFLTVFIMFSVGCNGESDSVDESSNSGGELVVTLLGSGTASVNTKDKTIT